MRKYTFTIEVTVEGDATEQQVRDYIRFQCNTSYCSILKTNPFMSAETGSEIVKTEIH